jgi:hypothetical protein
MFGRDELVFLCFAEPRGVGTCIGTSFSSYIAKVDMMILGVEKRKAQ